eukprot:PITA_14537
MGLINDLVDNEPSSFEEEFKQPFWVDAMVEEYKSIMKNNVWEVVPRPIDKSVVGSRWILKVKNASDGSIEKYKDRFVAKGFSQVEVIDYKETISPVASCNPIETPLVTNWRKENASSGEEVDATIYLQLVGSLMYLANTRTDMCYAVNQLSQSIVRPTKLYLKVAKHVLKHLKGTGKHGLWYKQIDGVKLCGFTDVD